MSNAPVREDDQVVVSQPWDSPRPAVVEYCVSDDSDYVDVRYVDARDEVEQVKRDRVSAA